MLPRPDSDDDDLHRATAVFAEVRPRLFGIAYRMLGSVTEAEDLVQDVWLRWQGTDRAAVVNPAAFLATAITRLAINALQSARARRETYIGPWLPEPVDTSADPYLGAERAEALELAVLLLLERLSPNERAAYVLREAFDYPYAEIASILRLSEPAALEGLFAADAVSLADSNGAVRAASRTPVVGASQLAKVVRAYASTFWIGVDVQWATLNGLPAAVLRRDGAVFAAITSAASADGIVQLLWHLNPAKLAGAVTTDGPARS